MSIPAPGGCRPAPAGKVWAVDTDVHALVAGGGERWGELPLDVLAVAVWRATAEDRRRRHRPNGCPTHHVPYGHEDPDGRLVENACRCAGCLDLVHELMTLMVDKIQSHRRRHPETPIVDLAAYADRVARTELIEWHRSRRTARGFPAKPARGDGAAGRISARLSEFGGDEGEWLVTLFRIMRSYPFSQDHVCGRWPLEGLAAERLKFRAGEPGGLDTIRHEIAQVGRVAREVAGDRWVFDNLVVPLNCNGGPCALPGDLAGPETSGIDHMLASWLRENYLAHRWAGLAPAEAFRRASLEVTGREPPAQDARVLAALGELDRSVLRPLPGQDAPAADDEDESQPA